VIPYGGKGAIRAPQPLTLAGQSGPEQERNPLVRSITISPDYFRVAGIPLLQGRPFAEEETQALPRVAIVSEAAAKRLWPGADPLGRRFKPGAADAPGDWHAVVGVVGDVKYGGLHVAAEPTIYYPYTQTSAGDFHTRALSSLLFGIAAGDPLTWSAALLLLPFVCLLASYLPARRASRVDPVVGLKQS
jgi:hypothetical protein